MFGVFPEGEADWVAPHPYQRMETHFPQFMVYGDVRQNLPRPTWKGARNERDRDMTLNGARYGHTTGLGMFDDLVLGVDQPAYYAGDPDIHPRVAFREGLNAGAKRGLLIGGAAGLVAGIAVGYLVHGMLGRRR